MLLSAKLVMPAWAMIPFGIMLLIIAIGPLVAEHWCTKNKNKLIVSLLLGVPTAIYLILNGMAHNVEHQLVYDYVPFIILLCALFVTTGGIHLSGESQAYYQYRIPWIRMDFGIFHGDYRCCYVVDSSSIVHQCTT